MRVLRLLLHHLLQNRRIVDHQIVLVILVFNISKSSIHGTHTIALERFEEDVYRQRLVDNNHFFDSLVETCATIFLDVNVKPIRNMWNIQASIKRSLSCCGQRLTHLQTAKSCSQISHMTVLCGCSQVISHVFGQ
jgi:hypothetical protein